MMKRLLLLLPLLLCRLLAAQTPTLVQSVWAENSGAPAAGAGGFIPCGGASASTIAYCLGLPEASLSGNLLVCSAFASQTTTLSISDDQSETWTIAGSDYPFTTGSSNVIYYWYKAKMWEECEESRSIPLRITLGSWM